MCKKARFYAGCRGFCPLAHLFFYYYRKFFYYILKKSAGLAGQLGRYSHMSIDLEVIKIADSTEKIVAFDYWCNKCANKKTDETEEPCNECLTNPTNWDSRKPVKFKKAETEKKKKKRKKRSK